MGGLIAVAQLIGNPTQGPHIAHPDRKRFGGFWHNRGNQRGPFEGLVQIQQNLLLGAAIKEFREISHGLVLSAYSLAAKETSHYIPLERFFPWNRGKDEPYAVKWRQQDCKRLMGLC